MINFSIIQKSQLEGALRIDAEYFQPEYLELEKKMASLNLPQLKDLNIRVDASAFYPSIAESYGDKGMPFVRVADVLDLQLTEDGLLFLPKEIVEKHKTLHIGKPGDIIITKGGTVGNIALLSSKYPKYALSRDIIFVKTSELPKEQSITILLFLASRFGLFQLIRGASLQVQPHLTLPLIRNLSVPHKIIKSAVVLYYESLKQSKKSKEYCLQAEELLLEELELANFKPKDDLGFVTNLSSVQESNRVDSDFFQPKYEEILHKLKSHKTENLIQNFEILRGKNFAYSENGEVGVIKTKQLGKQFISFEIEDKTKNETVEKENLPIIKGFDVVFASMGVGSLGKTDITYGFEIGENRYTIDSTLRIFRSKSNNSILPEGLSVYLSSWVGQELIYKYIVGSSGIISIYENYLKDFTIPILPKSLQREIAELVRKSHEARKKSKELLERAKRKVEEMIEKGGGN